MGRFTVLQLLGFIILQKKPVSWEEHPVLFNVLAQMGVSAEAQKNLSYTKKVYINNMNTLSQDFTYFGGQEMKVNEHLDRLLFKALDDLVPNAYDLSCHRGLGIEITREGNRGGEFTYSGGVDAVIAKGEQIIYTLFLRGSEDKPSTVNKEDFQCLTLEIEFIFKLLELVDLFLTHRTGMLAGVKEYPPVDPATLDPIPEPDFTPVTCSKADNCLCGCKLDDSLMVIQGIDDREEQKVSKPSLYLEGVLMAQGVAGNEGKVMDSIKVTASKVWESLKETLEVIRQELEKSDDEKIKEAEADGENNKKAIQAMESTPARINDTAKKGLIELCSSLDEDGGVKTMVSGINTPEDAARIIDVLLAHMGKQTGTELTKKLTTAQTKVADLKKKGEGATAVNEENKDVVAAKKAEVKVATDEAKKAVKDIRAELTKHNSLMSGLGRAIKGLSPKIFIEDTSGKKE